MIKILVTGAYGLVGSNLCKEIETRFPDFELTKVKFDDLTGCDGVYDYIIHGSGYGQPLKFSIDKLKTIYINTEFTTKLLDKLAPTGTFLFISSSEVYSGAQSPYKEEDIGNTTPQHPRACYIEGKRCGEAICMASGKNVKIARLALAYGPGTKKGDTRVLNQFIEQALTLKKITMKDKGEAVRTYAYIDDVVEQILNILFVGESVVYNVGGCSTVTIKNLADMIGYMTDAEVITGSEGLKGAPEDVKLDMTKTIREFKGFLTPISVGLEKTINYQKELYGIK